MPRRGLGSALLGRVRLGGGDEQSAHVRPPRCRPTPAPLAPAGWPGASPVAGCSRPPATRPHWATHRWPSRSMVSPVRTALIRGHLHRDSRIGDGPGGRVVVEGQPPVRWGVGPVEGAAVHAEGQAVGDAHAGAQAGEGRSPSGGRGRRCAPCRGSWCRRKAALEGNLPSLKRLPVVALSGSAIARARRYPRFIEPQAAGGGQQQPAVGAKGATVPTASPRNRPVRHRVRVSWCRGMALDIHPEQARAPPARPLGQARPGVQNSETSPIRLPLRDPMGKQFPQGQRHSCLCRGAKGGIL